LHINKHWMAYGLRFIDLITFLTDHIQLLIHSIYQYTIPVDEIDTFSPLYRDGCDPPSTPCLSR
jgi:hypothetical protein